MHQIAREKLREIIIIIYLIYVFILSVINHVLFMLMYVFIKLLIAKMPLFYKTYLFLFMYTYS